MEIPFDPAITLGPLRSSWHALLALLGMAAGTALGIWLLRERVRPADSYAVALAGIVGGLAGSRLLHVLDDWQLYAADPLSVFAAWRGGASVTGGVIGGVLAAGWMMRRLRLPLGPTFDAGAIGLGLGMAIGRVGDVVNGEHHAIACGGLPWCIRYTHPDSPGQRAFVHPAVAYEMLWDLAIVALLLWLRPRAARLGLDGRLIFAFLGLYGIGRFAISFLRLDPPWLIGLQQAQVVSIAFIAVAAGILLFGRRGASPGALANGS